MINFSVARVLFAFLASLFIVSTYLSPYSFSWLIKILPIVVLILMTFQFVNVKAKKRLLIGLLFSSMGDIWLDTGREQYFLYGLASFFLAHLMYIAAIKPQLKLIKQSSNALVISFYLLSGAVVFYFCLLENLGEMFIPVFAYMSVLIGMAISTLLSPYRNYWLVIGGVSFVISDTIIGLNKFYLSSPIDHSIIMFTYYLAQLGLVTGFWLASSDRGGKLNRERSTDPS
ncbi:lysoplasmalogenase [Thalassotalea ganghwensis]